MQAGEESVPLRTLCEFPGMACKRSDWLVTRLNAAEEDQDDDDEEHDAEASGGSVAPIAAMGPTREGSEEREN